MGPAVILPIVLPTIIELGADYLLDYAIEKFGWNDKPEEEEKKKKKKEEEETETESEEEFLPPDTNFDLVPKTQDYAAYEVEYKHMKLTEDAVAVGRKMVDEIVKMTVDEACKLSRNINEKTRGDIKINGRILKATANSNANAAKEAAERAVFNLTNNAENTLMKAQLTVAEYLKMSEEIANRTKNSAKEVSECSIKLMQEAGMKTINMAKERGKKNYEAENNRTEDAYEDAKTRMQKRLALIEELKKDWNSRRASELSDFTKKVTDDRALTRNRGNEYSIQLVNAAEAATREYRENTKQTVDRNLKMVLEVGEKRIKTVKNISDNLTTSVQKECEKAIAEFIAKFDNNIPITSQNISNCKK